MFVLRLLLLLLPLWSASLLAAGIIGFPATESSASCSRSLKAATKRSVCVRWLSDTIKMSRLGKREAMPSRDVSWLPGGRV